jgi:hypothetical protein
VLVLAGRRPGRREAVVRDRPGRLLLDPPVGHAHDAVGAADQLPVVGRREDQHLAADFLQPRAHTGGRRLVQVGGGLVDEDEAGTRQHGGPHARQRQPPLLAGAQRGAREVGVDVQLREPQAPLDGRPAAGIRGVRVPQRLRQPQRDLVRHRPRDGAGALRRVRDRPGGLEAPVHHRAVA